MCKISFICSSVAISEKKETTFGGAYRPIGGRCGKGAWLGMGLLGVATVGAVEGEDAASVVHLPQVEVVGEKIAVDSAVGTRINTALIETPQAVSVVTQREMEERGVQTLNDAVAYSAGVRPESGGLDSRTDTLTIRGYSVSGSGTSYVYLDGLRGLTGGGWTYSAFDPFGLERVEVLKGPAAVLYGQVGPGGIVNAVSKRPGSRAANEVAVQYGSQATLQGTFDVGGDTASKALAVRVLGLAREGEAEVDHTDLKRLFAAPSLTWNFGERGSITLLTQYQEDSGGATFQFLPKTGTLVAGTNGFRLARSTFLGEADWNNYERTQYAVGYQVDYRLTEQLTFRHSLRQLTADTDYKAVVATGTDAAANGNLARRIMWGYGQSDNINLDARLEGRFATAAIQHTLLGGIDLYDTTWDNTRWLRATDALNLYAPVQTGVNQTHLAAMLAGSPQVRQDVDETQLGVYAQEQAVWGRWHGTVGLRYDSYEMDSLNQLTAARAKVSPDSTTWRAALLYRSESGVAPYVSYTTSFDAGPYTTNNPATPGKTFEEPTTATQWEAGLKFQPETVKALVTASVFELAEDNRLSYYKDIATNLVYANQSGEAVTRGAELEGRLALHSGIDLIAAYCYLDTEITKSSVVNNLETLGNRLPGVAEHTGSLWLSYTPEAKPIRGVVFGVGARYVGATYDNVNNVTRLPAYTLFDASLTWDLGRTFSACQGLSARLSATNLTDKLYVASANVAPTANGAAVAYYGSGRNVTLSLRYAW